MSEILCPMCGQSNPGELETCQHCQARLKPLTADSLEKSLLASRESPDWLKDDDSDHPSDAPLDGAAEIKDWLSRIRSDDDSDSESKSSSPEKENDSDDVDDNWIEKVRTLKSTDDSTPETATPLHLNGESSGMASDGGIPKWLSDLGNNTELSPTSIAEPESQLPDWFESADEVTTPKADLEEETYILDRLAGSDVPPQPEAVPDEEIPAWFESADEAPTTQADPEEETASKLDWLDDSDQEPAMTSPAEKDDIPDRLAATDKPSQPEAVPAEEIPDWFASADEAPTTQADPEEEAASKLDWLDDSDQEPAIASPAEKDDIPDWLPAADEPSQPEAVLSKEIPDWFESADEVTTPKADLEEETDILDRLAGSDVPSQPEAVPDEEIPGWFASADEAPTTQADPEEEAASKLDWLDDTDQEPAMTSPAEKDDIQDRLAATDKPSQPEAVPAEEIPEWLTSADEASTTQADPEEEAASKLDWLDDSDQEPAITSPAEKDNIPDWLAAAAVPSQPEVIPTDDIPDWLTRADDLLEPKTESQPEEQAAALTSKQTAPDHLKEIEDISLSEHDSSPASLPTETSISDTGLEDDIFGTDQLPAWLIEYDEEDEPSYTVESDTNGLTPAALPDWIEAIRPKDMAGMESSGFQQHVPAETSGPLAGISDALKAEPEIVNLQKLPAYSVKLEVSEKQIQSAAILEKLIEQETAAPSVPPKPTAIPARAIRWIIASLFFIVISFAIISSEQPTIPRYQGMVPEQVFKASEQINALSPKDTVLIAFDYEPGPLGLNFYHANRACIG